MWFIILLAIIAIIVVIAKKSADKAKAEQLERERMEKQKKAEAEAKARKEKYEKITEAEKQQLLKIGGDELLTVTLTAFEKAVKGNAEEMTFLGSITYRFIIENPVKSAYWLQKAVNAGNLDAKFFLGEYYVNGYGVTENSTKGMGMIFDAARSGNKKAIESCIDVGMSVAEMRSIGIPV